MTEGFVESISSLGSITKSISSARFSDSSFEDDVNYKG